MLLPTTYTTALALMIVAMICWGSWANTFKVARKWRFELYYFDFAFGVMLAAAVAALTFGSFGDELTFEDNLLIAGKRQMAYATAAGMVFNLGNLLLVGAISLTGMAVAFPVALGLAMVLGVALSYILNPMGNPLLLFSGAALLLIAIVVDAYAYRANAEVEGEITNKFSLKGLIVALVSGVLLGSFFPLVELSRITDIGLGPYSIAFFMGIGIVFSTLVLNLYFMNLPLHGKPVGFADYFRGSVRNHMLGLAGGIIWCTGAIASLVAASAPPKVNVGPAVSYALGQAAPVIGALWGLLVWKEFKGAEQRVKLLLAVMIALFLSGITLISLAPLG